MKIFTLLFIFIFSTAMNGQDFKYHFLTEDYDLDNQIFADFNNDGFTDIFAIDYVSESPNRLIFLKNKGLIGDFEMDGSYVKYSIEANSAPVKGDFDNDDDLDIIVSVGFDNPEINMFVNDGTGVFTQKSIGIGKAKKLRAVDFDNDGDLDILGIKGSVIYYFNNDGSGNFIKSDTFDAKFQIWKLFATEFNNDNNKDILIYYKDQEEYRIRLFKNEGDFNFTSKELYHGDMWLNTIVIKDLDEDDNNDIIFNNEKYVFCYINNTNFNFTQKTIIEDPSFFSRLGSFDIGDIDNDGDLDIIIESGSSGLLLFKNQNAGSIDNYEELKISDEKSLYDITLVDFNNDNKLDIFVTSLYSAGIFENSLIINSYRTLNKLEYDVFPNPSNGLVFIKGTDINKITIRDIFGRVNNIKIAKNSSINISNLNAGLYLINIETNNGMITKKIIKR